MKRVWLTAISRDELGVQQLMKRLKGYGLEVDGHFWENDLKKMAWMGPREELLSDNTAAWLLYLKHGDLDDEDVRYGLSLLALTVTAGRGLDFPMFVLLDGAETTLPELPTPLAGFESMEANNPAAMARVVAAVHKPPAHDMPERRYRIDVYGNPQIGQWFETGPGNGSWHGAMFGVSGGDITFHAVGSRGRLPERSVLNYPVQGMDIEMGNQKFLAWGVQNDITENDSYFVKVDGWPDTVIFGPYSQEDQAEAYVLRLK